MGPVRELITNQLEELLRNKCTGLRQRKKARALSAWYACRMETTKAGRKQDMEMQAYRPQAYKRNRTKKHGKQNKT